MRRPATSSDQFPQDVRELQGYLSGDSLVPGVQAVTFKVSIALGSVPNAAKARVTLTQPSGTSTQSICTSSPCAVTGDRRQGDHQVLIEYLAADNKVLATGDRGRIRVP